MTNQDIKDVKDTAIKLNEIRAYCPDDYFYLKGWIHCLLQKDNFFSRKEKDVGQI